MPPITPIDCGNRRNRYHWLAVVVDVSIGSTVIGLFVLMIGYCLFAEALPAVADLPGIGHG